jgi:hypothetical protein
MDGVELRGVCAADVRFRIDEIPLVTLQFVSAKVTGDIENVIIKEGGDAR